MSNSKVGNVYHHRMDLEDEGFIYVVLSNDSYWAHSSVCLIGGNIISIHNDLIGDDKDKIL